MSASMEGQQMGDVVYHTRLGIGSRMMMRDITMPELDTMFVACPLPSLDNGDKVNVAVVDATQHGRVTCHVQTCRAGIGLGEVGEGACMDGYAQSTAPLPLPDGQIPYTQHDNYITQNVDWLEISAMKPDSQRMEGREIPEAEGMKGMYNSHLLCVLPARDTDPEAPGLPRSVDPNPIGYYYRPMMASMKVSRTSSRTTWNSRQQAIPGRLFIGRPGLMPLSPAPVLQ